jgi:hypothetical protein
MKIIVFFGSFCIANDFSQSNKTEKDTSAMYNNTNNFQRNINKNFTWFNFSDPQSLIQSTKLPKNRI